jgi:hypothetical protein
MAPATAPWASHFFAHEQAKAAPAPKSAMDDVLQTPVLDDELISPRCFRYMARDHSFTSLGHDADTEDFFAPPAVPRSAPAHTSAFQPFGRGRWFFALRPSGASSSWGVSVAAANVPRPHDLHPLTRGHPQRPKMAGFPWSDRIAALAHDFRVWRACRARPARA